MTDILGNGLNMRYSLLLPEILLGVTAVLVVFADLFSKELKIGYRLLPLLTVAGWRELRFGRGHSGIFRNS